MPRVSSSVAGFSVMRPLVKPNSGETETTRSTPNTRMAQIVGPSFSLARASFRGYRELIRSRYIVDVVLEVSMKGALTVTGAIVVSSAAVALPVHAQWLNHPTPNIPRTADGKPNL